MWKRVKELPTDVKGEVDGVGLEGFQYPTSPEIAEAAG